MNNGEYASVVKSGDENILKIVELGTLNLSNGSNESVSITNADKLLNIKNNEWFIIGGTFNTVQRRLYAYKFNGTINAFIHYGNVTSPDIIFITIKNISSENNTCNITYNEENLVGISEVLIKTNTTEYTPTSDYHPATKKYVDNKWFSINDLILELRKYYTPSDITEFVNRTYNGWDNLRNICIYKYLYRATNVPVNVSYDADGTIHLVIIQQNGSPHGEGKSFIYIEHFDIYKDVDETVKGYLVQTISLGKGDGTKALMDDGNYYKVVKDENSMILEYNSKNIVIDNIQSDGSIDITVTEDQYNFIVKHKLHQHFQQSFIVNNRRYVADVYGYNSPLDYSAEGRFYSNLGSSINYGNGALYVKLYPQGNNRFTGYVTEFLLLKDDNS